MEAAYLSPAIASVERVDLNPDEMRERINRLVAHLNDTKSPRNAAFQRERDELMSAFSSTKLALRGGGSWTFRQLSEALKKEVPRAMLANLIVDHPYSNPILHQ